MNKNNSIKKLKFGGIDQPSSSIENMWLLITTKQKWKNKIYKHKITGSVNQTQEGKNTPYEKEELSQIIVLPLDVHKHHCAPPLAISTNVSQTKKEGKIKSKNVDWKEKG